MKDLLHAAGSPRHRSGKPGGAERRPRSQPLVLAMSTLLFFPSNLLVCESQRAQERPLLSPRSAALARSLGMEPLVSGFFDLGCREPSRLRRDEAAQCLAMRQQITEKLLLASLEVSAVAALIDSEEERAEQAARILAEKERSRTTVLTSIAIAVGAAGAVAVGLSGREKIGIATGGVETAVGIMMLRGGKKVQFTHPKNPLRDFWFGRRQFSSFPASLWAYFEQTPSETNPGQNVRDQLMHTWSELHGFNDGPETPGAKKAALLFGGGGTYTQDDLRLRADLLDQLEALVNQMHEELRALLAELGNSSR